MEVLKVLDYSNVFIASYFTDDRQCAHPNREHSLIYILSGELEINERGKITHLHQGDCAFIRRDNRIILSKIVKPGTPYRSLVLKFSRQFLREYYRTMDRNTIPPGVKRDQYSLVVLPSRRPDIVSLFQSVTPYLDSGIKPSEEILKLKMAEGLYMLLHTDPNLYASLFDFSEPWKIDIGEFMNENYMYDLSMEEIAAYTGRSLSTFKRDFRKFSDLPPQKWILKRRLQAAHELIRDGKKKISEACFDVGFKNLSHFSKVYKQMYGFAPTNNL
ncbi:MAG: AraC family transcriptional regulator [Tannerellaceae bacterium]|nr:AraC family transcriptional regulator [Tannerellaceae bacterium]